MRGDETAGIPTFLHFLHGREESEQPVAKSVTHPSRAAIAAMFQSSGGGWSDFNLRLRGSSGIEVTLVWHRTGGAAGTMLWTSAKGIVATSACLGGVEDHADEQALYMAGENPSIYVAQPPWIARARSAQRPLVVLFQFTTRELSIADASGHAAAVAEAIFNSDSRVVHPSPPLGVPAPLPIDTFRYLLFTFDSELQLRSEQVRDLGAVSFLQPLKNTAGIIASSLRNTPKAFDLDLPNAGTYPIKLVFCSLGATGAIVDLAGRDDLSVRLLLLSGNDETGERAALAALERSYRPTDSAMAGPRVSSRPAIVAVLNTQPADFDEIFTNLSIDVIACGLWVFGGLAK